MGSISITQSELSERLEKFMLSDYSAANINQFSNAVDWDMLGTIKYLHSLQREVRLGDPKSHHVNPVFALGLFSTGTKRSKYRLIQHYDAKSRKRKAEDLACIDDFNTAKTIFLEDPYVVETYYSRIENRVANTIKSLNPTPDSDFTRITDDLILFLSMQITRSLRQRNLIRKIGESEFNKIIRKFEENAAISAKDLEDARNAMDDIALINSLRHINAHAFDLRNRSIVFVRPVKSKLITAADPAVFLDEENSPVESPAINHKLIYPINRDLLVMLLPKKAVDDPIEYRESIGDEMIDLYNLLLFSQTPNDEVFMHPEDEDYLIELIRSRGVEYNVTKL